MDEQALLGAGAGQRKEQEVIQEPANVDVARELRDKLQSEIGDLQVLIGNSLGKTRKELLAKNQAKIKDLRFIKQWLKDNKEPSGTLTIVLAQNACAEILDTIRGLEEENNRLKAEISELKIQISEQQVSKDEIAF